jgi:hypothetical protein
LGAVPLAIGITGSAHAAEHRPPPGAVKLPARSIEHVSGATCGKVGGVWRPGTVVTAHWFIADTQQAKNYQAAARHARARAKRTDMAQAKFYTHRAAEHQTLCTPAPSRGATGATTPTIYPTYPIFPGAPAPTPPTPLRFNLSGAIGLTLTDPSASAASAGPTATLASVAARQAAATATAQSAATVTPQSAATVTPQSAPTGTPSLLKVEPGGQLAPAVTSGPAPISHFLIGPNGTIYVAFSHPINLNDPNGPGAPGGCALAEVDPSKGVPTCVDDSLFSVSWNTVGAGPIQFDSSGAIYYEGQAPYGGNVLRKFDGTTTRTLLGDGARLSLGSFDVTPDATVLVTGETMSTGTSWTRRLSPAGSISTLANGSVSFMDTFPDGNVYIGGYGMNGVLSACCNGGPVVARYNTTTSQVDPEWWISLGASGPTQFSTASLCASPTPAQAGFCNGGMNNLGWLHTTPDGNVYALAQGGGSGTLMQYFPTVQFLPTQLATVKVVTNAGADLAAAGLDAAGHNVLTLIDPAHGGERVLLGPDNETEIYHLSYVASHNEVLFDGLRFSDGQYVVGEYNLSTGQLTMKTTGSGKLADLQAF